MYKTFCASIESIDIDLILQIFLKNINLVTQSL
jgi:hypothetical protein